MSELSQTDRRDGASPDTTLSPTGMIALRGWLQTQRRESFDGRAPRKSEMRRALRLVCRDVRASGEHVEGLIVLLKRLWAALGEDGASHSRSHEVIDEIISECIEEFYAIDGDAHSLSSLASLRHAD